jgi:GT2 family glycosyltransferase
MITIGCSETPIASVIILTHDNLELLAGCLASLQDSIDAGLVPHEVIVVFQEMDPHSVRSFLKSIRGIRPLQVPLNLGFGGANNFAARHARGRHLVFLNDDTTTRPGWLGHLVRMADADDSIAAVGSRIVFPDGRLQEAGAILWSDGSCYPVGRGERAESLAYSYVRPVDYASANGLLVRRASFEAVGGFDERFFPGYYEDLDLCMSLRHHLEQRIAYEPRSIIVHVESATMNRDPEFRAFLFRRHRAAFYEKWAGVLPAHPRPDPASSIAIEAAILGRMGSTTRLLLIDDRVPFAGLGSGFGRMTDLMEDLGDAQFAVAFYPSDRRHAPLENPLADLGVDVIDEPLSKHLQRPEKRYDVVVISRPHNFETFYDLLRASLPEAAIVYDAEALYHKRLRLQASLAGDEGDRARLKEQAGAMESLERNVARSVDRLVAVSDDELRWLEDVQGHAPMEFVRPLSRGIARSPSGPETRGDAVFVAGWLGGEESPNVDALLWYAREVVPHILERLPHFRTFVTGTNPPLSVEAIAGPAIVLMGFVASVERCYASARVAIVPVRAGAGVNIKTIEALQYGVPVVSTTVGAQGLGLVDGEAIDVTDDPREFALRIVALATDNLKWLHRREAIAEVVERWTQERTSWSDIVGRTLRDKESSRKALLQ